VDARLFALPVAAVLVGGCAGGPENQSRPSGCATFDRIAVTIESEGPGAEVGPQLRQIEQQARAGGDGAVADAAAALLAAQGGDPGRWYASLGRLEAACRGQR